MAVDAGSGVRETLFELDRRPAVQLDRTYSLASGTHSLVFFSVDNLDNREADQSVNLTVVAFDATPPSLAISPPDASTVTTVRPPDPGGLLGRGKRNRSGLPPA